MPTPRCLQPPHDIHQAPHIGFGQRRGRLIHDHHAGILRQGPGDFDALAVGHRKCPDPRIDVEVEAVETVEQLAGAPAA